MNTSRVNSVPPHMKALIIESTSDHDRCIDLLQLQLLLISFDNESFHKIWISHTLVEEMSEQE